MSAGDAERHPERNAPENAETGAHTICARPDITPLSKTRPLATPIQLSSVYEIADLNMVDSLYQGESPGYIYARDGHPNAQQFADKMAQLEKAEAGLICASGMAAITATLLSLLEQGDHLAFGTGIYGRTKALIERELTRYGIHASSFNATDPASLRSSLTARTKAVLVETISNPLLRLADLEGLTAVTKSLGIPLIVDHTFAPLLCFPIELGAQVVVHSATKLIGGHSDLTSGVVVGSQPFMQRVASLASTFGLTGNAFESWLALRGLKTLALRSDKACSNAYELALRMQTHSAVLKVNYPGLSSHPDHMLALRLLKNGYGAMVTIDLGSRECADVFIRSLQTIPFAPSLGDVATTLSHPATTSHRGQSAESWAAQGITPGLIRLSIGIEDSNDLWREFERALDQVIA